QLRSRVDRFAVAHRPFDVDGVLDLAVHLGCKGRTGKDAFFSRDECGDGRLVLADTCKGRDVAEYTEVFGQSLFHQPSNNGPGWIEGCHSECSLATGSRNPT